MHVPESAFTPIPAVRIDQVACKCGHAVDVHTLEDIRLTVTPDENYVGGEDARLYWRWTCTGMFVPANGRYGQGVQCTCSQVRSPSPLPPVEPEPGKAQL
jgi:hypothetical protein